MSNLFVAIFMGLIYWFTRLRIGYTFSSIMFQPVSIVLMVGFLYGDVATAMKIGAAVQLVYYYKRYKFYKENPPLPILEIIEKILCECGLLE